MSNLEEQYKEHYELYLKIVDSINITSRLINEFGKLPSTGVENIDNLYLALHESQTKIIEVFETLE